MAPINQNKKTKEKKKMNKKSEKVKSCRIPNKKRILRNNQPRNKMRPRHKKISKKMELKKT